MSTKDRGPAAAYLATTRTSPLVANRDLYEAIHTSRKQLVSSHTLPIRSGYAWELKAGQVCRIVTPVRSRMRSQIRFGLTRSRKGPRSAT